MQQWINWKDLNSNNLDVVVQTLPPITRPQLRVETIEIEGRDGNIINELGYSTYTKQVSIAFNNKDNIENIMDWLSGSGKLVLSNEPDRYYNAKIINQVDYTKSVRFRYATVTFLVQPYKYRLDEEFTESLIVVNEGFIDSKPLINIYGSGEVQLYINNSLACTLNIDGHITLDSELEDAAMDGILMNRRMNGNFPVFKTGSNVISYVGNVTKIETLVRSRWL